MIALHSLVIFLCLCVFSGWLFADYFLLWKSKIKSHFVWNEMDLYWSVVCLLPIMLGHFVTIWGNYFRSSGQFQRSISKVTTPASKQQRVSIWERHDRYFGCSVKFWILSGVITISNIYWFVLTTCYSKDDYIKTYGFNQGVVRSIAFGSSQAVLLDTSIILFLVLRRSLLHAIGFTYPEIVPVHRWLGAAMVAWSTIHAVFYSAWLIMAGRFVSDIAFTDKSRGTRNMPGVFAWIGVLILGFFAMPQFRRAIYPIFLYVHRVGAFVFFIGLIMHYPSVMLWYYMLPGFVLFLVDRFVPRMIQARTILPEASCAFNYDADIIRVKFSSNEPMKPYYPGDYITVQVPGLGNIYHPFTIASYWPEDPYTMTLYMRVFGESKYSWTKDLAKLCGTNDKRINVRANIEGVFGDRRHDYLKSEVMIIYVAGAAITTFMALIKAIAAQIAASNEPLRMQLHLICTFRTRSELHAYGSFLHQITRDPRFTSWLHVEIFVSRPDKPQTLMGAHAHVVKNDIMVPGKNKKEKKRRFATLKRTGTILKRALSGRTVVDVPATISDNATEAISPASDEPVSDISLDRSNSVKSTVDTLHDIKEEDGSGSTDLSALDPLNEKATKSMTYHEHALPTFEASSAHNVSKRLAALDLAASAAMVAIPLAFYYGLRTVQWESSPAWCPTEKKKDKWTVFVCMWLYALVPGLVHIVVMLGLGYMGIALARIVNMRYQKRGGEFNVEAALPYPDVHRDEDQLSVEDGNWDEGDVVYSPGRVDVRKSIQAFVEAGVGKKERGQGLVTVFAGGPEGYVDMVERQVRKASWAVEFHRETWAP